MKHNFAAVCLLLISGCTMNNNERKLSVDVLEVTENELKNIHSLLTQLNPKMSLQELQNNYKQVKDKEYKLYKAVTSDNSPVGLIGYIFNQDLCVGRAMYVDILVVDKNHRKMGIAKQLMDFAISKLHQDKKAHCIRWTTRNDLEEAIGFYKNKVKAPIGYYYRIDNPHFEE